jgi:hypothetical protein
VQSFTRFSEVSKASYSWAHSRGSGAIWGELMHDEMHFEVRFGVRFGVRREGAHSIVRPFGISSISMPEQGTSPSGPQAQRKIRFDPSPISHRIHWWQLLHLATPMPPQHSCSR